MDTGGLVTIGSTYRTIYHTRRWRLHAMKKLPLIGVTLFHSLRTFIIAK